MKKLNQKGMTGPVEIGLIAVFVVFVGFVAYRIGSARTDDNAANNAPESSVNEASEIALTEAETDEAKEVELPAEEEKKEEVPVVEEKPVEEEVKKTEPVEEEVKKDKIYISYVSSSMSLNGDNIDVTAKLESAQTGTCYLKLYQEGQEKLTVDKRLENADTCSHTFNKNDLPVGGKWEFHTWFNGDDGKTEAYRSVDSLNITL